MNLSEENGKPLSSRNRWVNKRMAEDIAEFDHVIYQSCFSKLQADQYLQPRTQAVSIIYNGVDTSFLVPKRNLHRNKPTILSLRQYHHEEVRLALRVFEQVRRHRDCSLVIVGPMRDASISLESIVNNYSGSFTFRRDVKCLGTVSYEQLPDIFSRADVFLHLKVGDCCPNTVLESLSCGIPVVCPAWGGQSELVGSGGIAVKGLPWSVDEHFVQGMAEAVMEILDEQEDYAEAARAIAVERFDMSKIGEEYLNVLLPPGF